MAARHIVVLLALVACPGCSDHSNVSSTPSVNQPDGSKPAGLTATDVTGARATDPRANEVRKAKNKVRFYHVRGLQAWGDYGDVLVNGYALNSLDRREDERLRVSRTGPFMPPITFPGASAYVVVSDAFRQQLSKSALGDFKFRPVTKEHIVELHWEKWDRATSPAKYPDSGEPEDYLAGPHSPRASEELGDLWEVVLRRGATVKADMQFSPPGVLPLARLEIRVDKSTWNGDPIFLGVDPKSAHDWRLGARFRRGKDVARTICKGLGKLRGMFGEIVSRSASGTYLKISAKNAFIASHERRSAAAL